MVQKRFAGYRHSLDQYRSEAVKWRDKAYQRLYDKPIPQRIFHAHEKATGTGIPGVRRIVKRVRYECKSGEVRVTLVPCIIGEIHAIAGQNYRRPSGSRSRIFSINKYGEAEAIRLAAVWRRQMHLELERPNDGPQENSDEPTAHDFATHVVAPAPRS